MRVTREDVARRAGVSAATVSYILNHSRKFSDETVKRVMDAVEELQYKPDMIARGMLTNKTKQLSLVMDTLANPYQCMIASGFEAAAIENGYFTNICAFQNHLDNYLENFSSRHIDGAFILTIPNSYNIEKLDRLVDSGTKVIASGVEEVNFQRMSLIDNNYGEGMLLLYEHLYALGHRDIVYLNSVPAGYKYDSRRAAFEKCVRDYVSPYAEMPIWTNDAIGKDITVIGKNLSEQLLASGKHFTAVICTNDSLAIGAINTFMNAGLRVPEDVSVVGFGHIVFGEYWQPSITSVYHDQIKFGKMAFDILRNDIEHNVTGFYQSEVRIFHGGSTAPPKK